MGRPACERFGSSKRHRHRSTARRPWKRARPIPADAHPPSSDRWLVSGIPRRLTDGGSLRAHYIFRELIARTGASVLEAGGGRALASAVVRHPSRLRARLAAAQLLRTRVWPALRVALRPTVLDLFDHPVLHHDAIGLPLPAAERRHTDRLVDSMIDGFARVVVVSESFAELTSVSDDRRVVIPNGTDTSRIRTLPFPDRPVVGMVSSATPARGIETLVAAARHLRDSIPGLRVHLGLGMHRSESPFRAYADTLMAEISGVEWIRVAQVPYAGLTEFLGSATVLAVLPPAGSYWDAAAPVKLFDSMAAGRPVVTTPRVESARFVRECGAGLVAAGDRVEDVAAALSSLLEDGGQAVRLGQQARRCAVEHYDWSVLSARLADEILAEAGG